MKYNPAPRRALKGSLALLALLEICSFPFALRTRADAPPEPTRMDRLRAAYLFSFAKLVEWPSTQTGAFTFCFIGARGVRGALVSGTAGRTLNDRPIATRAIGPLAAASGCQVLYVESSRGGAWANAAVVRALTVGDSKPFTHEGGILSLFEEHNRLRFEVNLDNAQRAGVRLSPELVKAASIEGPAP